MSNDSMKRKIWAFFDERRNVGVQFNLDELANYIINEKADISKKDIIEILIRNKFFGEYYTPDDVAHLMAQLGAIKNPKSLIDICCGIGNILSFCDYADDISGIDINAGAVRLAQITNPTAHIEHGNSLEIEFNRKFDLVFGAFPFGMQIRRGEKSYPAELLFVKKSLSILNPNGVLICLVPYGFLLNSRFKEIRTDILTKFNLRMLLNIPHGVIPNTSIRSSIIYIENSPPKESVLFNDFSDKTAVIIQNFLKGKGKFSVLKTDMHVRWDREYHSPEYKEMESSFKGRDVKKLDEIGDVFSGYSPQKFERLKRGEYLLIGGRNITDGVLQKTDNDSYINFVNRPAFKNAILRSGDIIVSLLFQERKLYVYKENDPKAVLNSSCALIRSPHGGYINSYLKTKEGQKLFLKQAERATTSGNTIPRITLRDLKQIKIPILPIDNLDKFEVLEKSSKEELMELIENLDIELRGKFSLAVRKFAEEIISRLQNKIANDEITQKIECGESTRVEFKSTLRWNIHTKKFDKEVENSVLKTLVAFCNSEGGELFIGVEDNGTVIGLELDKFKNDDKFLLHLGNLIKDRIYPIIDEYVDFNIAIVDGNKVCHVICNKSKKPIILKVNGDQRFYVRTGPSSKELVPLQMIEYIKDHFRTQD